MEASFHLVARGDTVTHILIDRYGSAQFHQHRSSLLGRVSKLNPHLRDINHIVVGDVLVIPELLNAPTASPTLSRTETEAIVEIARGLKNSTPAEASMILQFTQDFFVESARSVATEFIGLTRHHLKLATPSLHNIASNYESLQAREISRGAYNGRRATHLKTHGTSLGFLDKLVYPRKAKGMALRIDTRKGAVRLGNVLGKIGEARRVSRLSKGGGVLLAGAGLGVACAEIAFTDDQKEKNLILVDNAAAMATGAAIGLALLMAATPVGWVGLVLIGVGSVGAGKIASTIYDMSGTRIDFASATGVSRICSSDNVASAAGFLGIR